MRARTAKRVCVFLVSTSLMLILGFFAGRQDLQRAAADTARCLSHAQIIRADANVAKDDDIAAKLLQPGYMADDFSEGTPPAVRTAHTAEVVWLYSLITTDYDGPNVISHFLEHYSNMGVAFSRIYVDLLHDPALSNAGLVKARQMFEAVGAHIRTIAQPYTPDLQDQAMVSGLSKMPMHIQDWVVVADMDEFFTFGVSGGVDDAVTAMNAEGATFALGEMLDHVAHGGELKHIDNSTDIWAQFPLVCPIVSNIAKGLPAKVTLAKAYLRTGAGHHHIVEPYLAHAYFSNECTGVPCELVMKRYKQRTLRDLYDLTPYFRYVDSYEFAGANDGKGWHAKQWSHWTKVHHFKWHAAVLDNLLFRMTRDSGDCLLDINEDICQPVFQFWKEVARQFHSLNATRSIDISSMSCKEGVDTLWNWR